MSKRVSTAVACAGLSCRLTAAAARCTTATPQRTLFTAAEVAAHTRSITDSCPATVATAAVATTAQCQHAGCLTVRLLETRAGTATTEPVSHNSSSSSSSIVRYAQRWRLDVRALTTDTTQNKLRRHFLLKGLSIPAAHSRRDGRPNILDISPSPPCPWGAARPSTHFFGSQRRGSATSSVRSYCSSVSLICTLLCSSTYFW